MLAGIALAAPTTAVALVLDVDRAVIGLAWTIAVAWTAVASLAVAFRCGIVDRDRSVFRGRRHACFPESRAGRFDWDTRTGRYAYMRTRENRQRLPKDDSLRNRRGI